MKALSIVFVVLGLSISQLALGNQVCGPILDSSNQESVNQLIRQALQNHQYSWRIGQLESFWESGMEHTAYTVFDNDAWVSAYKILGQEVGGYPFTTFIQDGDILIIYNADNKPAYYLEVEMRMAKIKRAKNDPARAILAAMKSAGKLNDGIDIDHIYHYVPKNIDYKKWVKFVKEKRTAIVLRKIGYLNREQKQNQINP